MSDLICRKTMQRCQTPGMCLPFQGCPDPMQRTMHDQLAAKGAEIAELITQLDSARHNAEAAETFRAAYLRERDEALEQLTEARECVGRLFPLAGMWVDQLAHEAKQPMTGSKARKLAAELDEARAALAATPEHLR